MFHKFLSLVGILHSRHSRFSQLSLSTDRGVRFASFGLSSFQHFVWQEFVQSVTFSEDFDAVLSSFKSFFDDWNLLENEEL